MANDPNRDLLPVKDIDDRSTRGAFCRADRNVVAKLKRCDLEDRYMRLYDENTQLKKQLNCQEEKIKRLGTKLLRLISEKKNCPDSNIRRHESKGLEELRMRIIELQHENYTLKDRNVVLKQQLASHARQHVAAHRSPNRSLHTSPRISNRQSSAPNVNGSNYILSSRNQPQDVQLREAEEHIHGLNEKIKSLHNKIDILQQDLEKSSLENQKTKVCENIELIRLQRSLKQQSIQIASLQAHIKSSEKSQKLLRDELAVAHKENEQSLQVISDKQKEILDLYTKLEESKVIRLEQEEMKERINDLTTERNSLRETGEFLMKTIEAKSSESDIVNDLKKLLVIEKAKKKELKQSLENTQKVIQSLKDSGKTSRSQSSISVEILSGTCIAEEAGKVALETVTTGTQTAHEIPKPLLSIKTHEEELELLTSTQLDPPTDVWYRNRNNMMGKECKNALNARESGKSCETRCVGTETEDLLVCGYLRIYSKEVGTQTGVSDFRVEFEPDGSSSEAIRIFEAEKLNLERELDYVKQMLRSQTERCSAQDDEINQLKSDLRVSEEKYNDTLMRLDLQLKIFRHLDSRAGRNIEVDSDAIEQKYLSLLAKFDEDTFPPRSIEDEEQGIASEEAGNKKRLNSSASVNESSKVEKNESSQMEKDGKLRFIRRKYLDSSDEEEDDDDDLINKDEILVRGPEDKGKTLKQDFSKRSSFLGQSKPNERFGSESSDSLQRSESVDSDGRKQDVGRPIPKPRKELPKATTEVPDVERTDAESQKPTRGPKPEKKIWICIEWLKLEPETSLWYNDSVKLLFVDFRFLDVKGEETETPSSLKKPKKSVEKCHYNFTKSIDINDYRLNTLLSVRSRPEDDLVAFKIVSEPDESSDEDECVDVGVAVITVKQFFESNPNASLLLPVRNAVDVKEKIGILSVRLNISAISEYFK